MSRRAGAAPASAGSGAGAPTSAHASSRPNTRRLRVAEEIRHVLAGVFARGGFRDPDLETARITATEVRVSPDMKHATVFVSRLGREDVDMLLPALRRAAPFLRAQLAQAMRGQRYVPDLHFQADTALDYAMHVDRLLRRPEVARDLD